MLDDLRNSSNFIEEEEVPEEPVQVMRRPVRLQRQPQSFLGMTAQQRFILSLMLFFMVLILGFIALVASGSFYIPGIS